MDLILAGADPFKPCAYAKFCNAIMHRARPGDAPVHIACRTPPRATAFCTRVQDSTIDMLQTLLNRTPAAAANTAAAGVFDAKGRNFLYVATSNNLPSVCSWIIDQPVGPDLLDTGDKAPIFAAIERVSSGSCVLEAFGHVLDGLETVQGLGEKTADGASLIPFSNVSESNSWIDPTINVIWIGWLLFLHLRMGQRVRFSTVLFPSFHQKGIPPAMYGSMPFST